MTRRRVHPTLRWFVAASILLGAFAIRAAPVADAHAVLESSSPADQSVVEGSPSRVQLAFSEPVSLVSGSLRVFDVDGDRVDAGLASHGASSSQVVVDLKPDLPAGSYAVAWRVVSADSHPVHGGFVFSVRRAGSIGDLDTYLDQPSQPVWDVTGGVLRAIGYLGSFLLTGAAVFVQFVRRRSERPGRLGTAGVVLGVVTVGAQVAQLPVAAALATGEGPGSLFSAGVMGEVLSQGTALTIAGVALAAVAALLALVRPGRFGRWSAVVSVLLVSAAYVASGHTRTTHPVWLVVIADAVHVAAATLWLGGLFMLAWSLRTRHKARPPDDPVVAAEEVVRFSRLATGSIIAVAVAGATLALLEIGSIDGLVSTAYGRLVLAKVALLVVLAGLGGFNQFRLVPALVARPDRPARWGYLRRTLRAEAVALVAVLGVTAALVNVIPAKTSLADRSLYAESVKLGSGSVNLVIDPARTGPTALHMYLLDAQGRPDDSARTVVAALTLPKLDIGPVSHRLHRAGPGHYVVNGTLFTVAGDWQVTMRVRVDEFTEDSAVLKVPIRR